MQKATFLCGLMQEFFPFRILIISPDGSQVKQRIYT